MTRPWARNCILASKGGLCVRADRAIGIVEVVPRALRSATFKARGQLIPEKSAQPFLEKNHQTFFKMAARDRPKHARTNTYTLAYAHVGKKEVVELCFRVCFRVFFRVRFQARFRKLPRKLSEKLFRRFEWKNFSENFRGGFRGSFRRQLFGEVFGVCR